MGLWEPETDEEKQDFLSDSGGACLYSQNLGGRGRWISVSSRLAWLIERVPGQAPKLHRETLPRKNQQQRRRRRRRRRKRKEEEEE
ncbi:hypothetical protein LEMLEM_LOCUS1497 [Lemmus lemmus]